MNDAPSYQARDLRKGLNRNEFVLIAHDQCFSQRGYGSQPHNSYKTDTNSHTERGLGSSYTNRVLSHAPPHDDCSGRVIGAKKSKTPKKLLTRPS